MYHFYPSHILKTSLAACLVALVMPAVGATSVLVPVEEFSVATPAVQAQVQQTQQKNANAELFLLLGSLQQEVAQLRGKVEELTFKLRQMEKNQKDRYIDIDRRITNLNAQQTAAQPSPVQTQPEVTVVEATLSKPAVVDIVEPDSAQQRADYKTAFNLIRVKKFEQAIAALLTFVGNYPNGTLTGNAHYWLGEVYMVERYFASAIIQFSMVINQFPDHRKVPEALYKTGLAWIKRGDAIKGQRMLEQVINRYPDSSAARLARELNK